MNITVTNYYHFPIIKQQPEYGKNIDRYSSRAKNREKKVQLIYAFNGTGKTQLSRAFKELVSPKHEEEEAQDGDTDVKVLYYNAFTEDLFYWDNDLEKIQTGSW